MITPSPNFVSTDLGRLHVRRTGTGPPVVLWHSLFVDSRSWGSLVDMLARDRTVYTIDGPSHGKSEAVRRDFTFEECVASAEEALDRLGLTERVDWVGNAWGGHVGIRLATGPRLRTLTTIGTPVQAFTLGEKLTKGWPLVELYRFAGPNGFILKQLSDSLLGAEAIAAEPDQAATVIASFRDATIPDCRVEEVTGGGHVAPLLLDPDRILQLLTEFWSAES
jgi:pimeloyl-ACP methyl ester carboxylesterase